MCACKRQRVTLRDATHTCSATPCASWRKTGSRTRLSRPALLRKRSELMLSPSGEVARMLHQVCLRARARARAREFCRDSKGSVGRDVGTGIIAVCIIGRGCFRGLAFSSLVSRGWGRQRSWWRGGESTRWKGDRSGRKSGRGWGGCKAGGVGSKCR